MRHDISDQVLDRLVDGELSDEERRGVLKHLENAPGGWRRCALAFLESQVWRQSARRMTRTVDETHLLAEKEVCPATTVARQSVSPYDKRIGYWATVAALIVAAFFLGRINGPRRPPGLPSNGSIETFAEQPKTQNRTAQEAALAATVPEVWARPLEVPKNVEESLKRLGVEVRHSEGLAPARNEVGQPVWVPYRDVTIVPVSNREMY